MVPFLVHGAMKRDSLEGRLPERSQGLLWGAGVPPVRPCLDRYWLQSEAGALAELLPLARLDDEALARVEGRAVALVEAVRAARPEQGGLDAFLHEYDLSSQEGVVLMCLAEALLRIPDAATADRLIQDKLGRGDWRRHLGGGRTLLVNAGTWGLMLTGRLVRLEEKAAHDPLAFLERLAARSGEPLVRLALRRAMHIIARQFVMGRDMDEALARSREVPNQDWLYSYDMLGEAALTAKDAEAYCRAYEAAIDALAPAAAAAEDVFSAPGISVKLSALHPRFEPFQQEVLRRNLAPRLLALAQRAREAGIGLTIDAEEVERLDITLDMFECVYGDAGLEGWEGLGLAVQAYQKRAPAVIRWLAGLAARHGRRIPLRLVKGAYWDAEIKRAQIRGLDDYPVYTRKEATDVAYLACTRLVLDHESAFYPQFATHNAYTVARVLEMAGGRRRYEFQRLHGMGEALYRALASLPEGAGMPCRVYAPVGGYEALLPYLVRRLLENGANTSFVNRIVDASVPVAEMVADPVARLEQAAGRAEARLPPPPRIFGADRRNARGLNLHDRSVVASLARDMGAALEREWAARPLVAGQGRAGPPREIRDPADPARLVGVVEEADEAQVAEAVDTACAAFPPWCATPAETRAATLERAAALLEAAGPELMALCVREGGRTVPDALAELREAVDYCLYYAAQARAHFQHPLALPGPVGERNRLWLRGRGVFVCISPWNFPLAIFTGQVTAALAAGNTVIAKPASQTPLVAARAVALLHEAGVPGEVLQLLPGSGSGVGMALVSDPRVAGVAFTGSTETAWRIQRALAARDAPIAALIAETGGMNCMIADSSALPEQLVTDAVRSAFNSAGQRCSALRVLFLQEEIAPRVETLLRGAMAELRVGDPALLATDVGPLIGPEARQALADHDARMAKAGRCLAEAPGMAGPGWFHAPRAYALADMSPLRGEVFGPVLHVIRYHRHRLDAVVDAINATSYGLTLGVHSRIQAVAEQVRARARVGNVYVNRDIIGAVVGVQPFGGEGLSGTGPKAGGPHYLLRFASEQTFTENTAAVGGDPELLGLAMEGEPYERPPADDNPGEGTAKDRP